MTNNYAGFCVRAAARLIDLLISGIISLIVFIPALILQHFLPFDGAHIFFNIGIADILAYFASAIYFILLTRFNNGQTLGKKLFRIKVISSENTELSALRVIYRETVGRYLTGLLGIGYIVAGALPSKQGFHDMLADTYVVYDLGENASFRPKYEADIAREAVCVTPAAGAAPETAAPEAVVDGTPITTYKTGADTTALMYAPSAEKRDE